MDRQGLSLRTKWKVESFTEKGRFYNVEKFGEEWICDCPSFENRHIECKHIKKIKADTNLESGSELEKVESKSKFEMRYILLACWWNGKNWDVIRKEIDTKKQLLGAVKLLIDEINPYHISIIDLKNKE